MNEEERTVGIGSSTYPEGCDATLWSTPGDKPDPGMCNVESLHIPLCSL